MADVHCFTSASFSYLDRARILAETVKRYHPDWTLWLCLSDREPPDFTFNLHREPFDRLVRIEELGIPDLDRWMFGHDLVELCTAVKGPMLCHVLKSGATKIIYLDPDIALFGTLDEATSLLDDRSIVLTPHQVAPDQTPAAILDNEIGSLKHGIYNLGFIAVSSCEEGVRFAHWWRDRLMSYCIDDIPSGLFTDQRWCDLVPAFFPGTKILRNPGYNALTDFSQTSRPDSRTPKIGNGPARDHRRAEIWENSMQKVLFIHIPKTAGTSIASMFYRAVPIEEINPVAPDSTILFTDWKNADKYKYFFTYLPVYVRSIIPGESKFMFTFVRDPIDRARSAYNHIRRAPHHRAHVPIVRDNVSFEESLTHPELWPDTSDVITRTLGLDLDLSTSLDDPQKMFAMDWAAVHKKPDDSMYLRARNRVDTEFDFIGFADRLGDDMQALGNLLGQAR